MSNLTDIGKQIRATTEALAKADAELKWELAASAADVAGMIDPTPASDLIGAGLAVRKGDWLGAGMSLVSVVPYLGDAVAKPAKAVRAAKRINELRQTVTTLSAQLASLRKAEKQAQAAEAAGKARIAKEAAEGKVAKDAADSQKHASKRQQDQDCKDCGEDNGKGKNSKPSRLPETKVPCFHPYDKKKFARLSDQRQQAYLREMSKQLQRQQDAINKMSARDFDAASKAFGANKRNPAAKARQEDLRSEKLEEIQMSIAQSLRRSMSRAEAKAAAEKRAKEIMSTLAALHEPDMVVGGYNTPGTRKIGRSDINSAIGAGWNQSGRAQSLYDSAAEAVEKGKGDELMNARLEVCRGKGKR
ncbi:MAG: polymorphic toxin type 15 domain-containing protein [Pseudomonadota bacterium]